MDSKVSLEVVERIYTEIKISHNFHFSLKKEQVEIIQNIINGKDVFCLLKTGFGKSLCFMLPPLLLDKLYPDKKHIALVVSPLKALIQDQLGFLNSHNVPAAAIIGGTNIDLPSLKNVSVILSSPEAVLVPRWSNLIKQFRNRICLQVYDEGHCISSWGLDFRPHYRRVSELQSFISAPTLVLTATATSKIQDDIYEVLSLNEDTVVIASLPDRPYIFLDMIKVKEAFREELLWIVDMLKSEGVNCKKTIIYVRSINVCFEIYLWMCISLGIEAFDKEKGVANRLIEMFHANTDEESKSRILDTLISEQSTLRILISTVAFGMGVNVPDIGIVVHWGLPSSALNYWQETGRCARDGREGYAICYAYSRSVTKCEDDSLKLVPESDECLRYKVLSSFLLDGMNKKALTKIKDKTVCEGDCSGNCRCSNCMCCIICWRKCTCEARVTNCKEFYISKS